MNNQKIIVFTDLDGTLLDHQNYSYGEAEEALSLIREKKIPLILCSSKTKEEIEVYRKKLLNCEPFISENGGAIFVPEQYEGLKFESDNVDNGYLVIEIGSDYKDLIEAFEKIKACPRLRLGDNTGINIKSISEFTIDEVVNMTGLRREEAILAMERQYSLPFVISDGENEVESIKNEISSIGFRFTEGARFIHLMGENDKGRAVKRLVEIFKKNRLDTRIITVGLGDSLNDLPMLEAVDRPFLVKKSAGNYEERIKVENLIYADGIGPVGWNKAILGLFSQ